MAQSRSRLLELLVDALWGLAGLIISILGYYFSNGLMMIGGVSLTAVLWHGAYARITKSDNQAAAIERWRSGEGFKDD